MMRPILAGLDTEYGFSVEARGAENQIEDSQAFVRTFPGAAFVGWDYRHEAPRSDLRGFRLDALAFDPEDAKFDAGRTYGSSVEIRSDRVLTTGGRFYNDHGHPEYATPECFTLRGLVGHELAGDEILRQTARAYEEKTGKSVALYKNNTDFHGASWGTHENYLVSRSVGYEKLFKGVMPMLLVRQILTGSGKVGSETGAKVPYQISQRADFIVEPANAETLYRRPLFNTRDEPHSRPTDFIRLHVISGDANMIAASTFRKVGLVKLAVALTEIGAAPLWDIKDPVRSFQSISRDEGYRFEIPLAKDSWTTADEILESYFSAAERFLDLDEELQSIIDEGRKLLQSLRTDFPSFARTVDWAAKRQMLEMYMQDSGTDWNDPALRSYDLEYHNLNADESLHSALVDMDLVVPNPEAIWEPEHSRAWVRGYAVQHFASHLKSAAWRSLTFEVNGQQEDVELWPDQTYNLELDALANVNTFIQAMREMK